MTLRLWPERKERFASIILAIFGVQLLSGFPGAFSADLPATTSAIITTVAGNGTEASEGDGGLATAASIDHPWGVAFDDTTGNLYISEYYGHRVRTVTPDGIISTVAGNGSTLSATSHNVDALGGTLSSPAGLAFRNNTLYVASQRANLVRTVSDGVIRTVAGGGSETGSGVAATSALLNQPVGVALDSLGTLYIADTWGCRVVKVLPDGMLYLVAGNGTCGAGAEGLPANRSAVSYVFGLALDWYGNLLIVENMICRVRNVSKADGTIRTIVGDGVCATADSPSSITSIGTAVGIAFDRSNGAVYIADSNNNAIRALFPSATLSVRVAGNGTQGYGGDNGLALQAALNIPAGLASGRDSTFYIADHFNNRVRAVRFPASPCTPVFGQEYRLKVVQGLTNEDWWFRHACSAGFISPAVASSGATTGVGPAATTSGASTSPGSGLPLCAMVNTSTPTTTTITCGPDMVFTNVTFASFGTPSGACGNFQRSTCHAENSSQIVAAPCLGRSTCVLPFGNAAFLGDPCPGTPAKQLFVQFECGAPMMSCAGTPVLNPIYTASTTMSPAKAPSLPFNGPWHWNSGAFPVQWIQVDFGVPVAIQRLKMMISQLPDGLTQHVVLAGSSDPPATEIYRFKGVTAHGQQLDWTVIAGCYRYLRIVTVESGSWVAWRSIRVFNASLWSATTAVASTGPATSLGATTSVGAAAGERLGTFVRLILQAHRASEYDKKP
eukprot:TRINITY_DN8649_c1_g1_i3.p1 TRINITY_DN8649_c1_g1~~TRINITY_DN8649_c1_g1_i3.p1  ORF type:complete len:752 (-),score=156.45 TRINITY_DN8649_c1_g1_i3:494-2671(-)